MPDQNEVKEYKKKISALSLSDLKDILSHINKDKVPWKYELVKAEIEAKESGKPAGPVSIEETEVESKEEETKETTLAEKPPEPPPVKPSFQLRRSKFGVEMPSEKPTPPSAPPKAEEKKAEEVKPVETKPEPVAPEPVEEKAAEVSKPAPEPKPAPVPKKEEKPKAPKTPGSPLDYAMIGAAIMILIIAIYIVAIPFVNLPGAGLIKQLLSKIPIF